MSDVQELEQHSNGVVEDVVEQPPRFSKDSWLNGATDLEEAEVYVEALRRLGAYPGAVGWPGLGDAE